ncbi:aspartyl protease family protein [Saccharicrinis sp. FJH54]|uniref:aspartyl protease family protein n=1 Tax=Saccharicrinis sp. FJH54 TaxID=3344665 RepID=UPI0035D45867
MRNLIATLLLFTLFNGSAFCLYNEPDHVINFEMIGTNIIVPVVINNSTPLNFIFDTGIRHTIVTELYKNDSLDLNYVREVTLHGLGEGEPLSTYLSTLNSMTIQTLRVDTVSLYALKQNIFQLSKHLGSKINGMIGYDLIKDHIVKIDYIKKCMYFYDPATYKIPRSFKEVPVTIEDNKAYITANVILSGEEHKVKLLVDTGAELALWLVNSNFKHYRIPDQSIYTYIGQGLNGEIFGSVSRIDKAAIGSYRFKKPIVAFPDSSAIEMIITSNERDGTIGSELLRRFHVILNYPDTMMYVKRNIHYSQRFKYNTTGIEVVQPYQNLPFFEIAELWDESPAANAGLRVGDKIESIDGQSVSTLTLIEVKEMLRKPSGKIRLNITRQNGDELIHEKIKFKLFKL